MANTRADISFDELCRGEKEAFYVIDPKCLVEITHEDTMATAEKKLVEKIDELFLEMQNKRSVEIKKIYISKAFVTKKVYPPMLDVHNPSTWNLEGITSRWRSHKTGVNREDGMIVIAVIRQVPSDAGDANKEKCALALENRLLQQYESNPRLDNDTRKPGKGDQNKSDGYALYVAFSFTDKEVVQESDDEHLFSGQPLEDPTAGNINQDSLTEQTAKMSISEKDPVTFTQKRRIRNR